MKVNVFNFVLHMARTYAAWNRGTPTPISLTIYNISPHQSVILVTKKLG